MGRFIVLCALNTVHSLQSMLIHFVKIYSSCLRFVVMWRKFTYSTVSFSIFPPARQHSECQGTVDKTRLCPQSSILVLQIGSSRTERLLRAVTSTSDSRPASGEKLHDGGMLRRRLVLHRNRRGQRLRFRTLRRKEPCMVMRRQGRG